nr:CIA30 family protein [Jannaschia pohangensis]
MNLSPNWEYVADTVMGGVSRGGIETAMIDGQRATRLTGDVSLENNGGFVQMAADLGTGDVLDASDWTGIEVEVRGNGQTYDLRLRTTDLTRPWQSYRTDFTATDDWTVIRVPFTALEANRTDVPLNLTRLRRIGILAVGRKMNADVAVAGLRLYR